MFNNLIKYIKQRTKKPDPVELPDFEIVRFDEPNDGFVAIQLINDDETHMDFVTNILEVYFLLDKNQATKSMFEAHYRGSCTIGWFTRELGAKIIARIMYESKKQGYPLDCKIITA